MFADACQHQAAYQAHGDGDTSRQRLHLGTEHAWKLNVRTCTTRPITEASYQIGGSAIRTAITNALPISPRTSSPYPIAPTV
jgi:hypothetical protein